MLEGDVECMLWLCQSEAAIWGARLVLCKWRRMASMAQHQWLSCLAH